MQFLTPFFLVNIILFSPASWAEYRVFKLKITKMGAAPGEDQDFRLVESTLDPQQYRFYYPVSAEEKVTYTETWMCRGRTSDFQPHCPNPKGQIPEDEPPAP